MPSSEITTVTVQDIQDVRAVCCDQPGPLGGPRRTILQIGPSLCLRLPTMGQYEAVRGLIHEILRAVSEPRPPAHLENVTRTDLDPWYAPLHRQPLTIRQEPRRWWWR